MMKRGDLNLKNLASYSLLKGEDLWGGGDFGENLGFEGMKELGNF